MTSYPEEDIVSLDTVGRLPQGGGIDPPALDTVREWCRSHAETFAGLVVSGSTLYVGFTADTREHLKTLRELVPAIAIRAFEAEHTYFDLLALVARISNDLSALQREGIDIAGVGIADGQNRVVLDLVRGEPTWIEHLRRRYGEDFVMFRVTGRFYALPGPAHS